jgi:hypothetical protein
VEEDMDAVRKAAEQVRFPFNRYEILNRLSSLPEPKAKMKKALKDRMRYLAASYISLATFVDDEDVEIVFKSRTSKRSKEIFQKVLKDIERAQRQMKQFRLLG